MFHACIRYLNIIQVQNRKKTAKYNWGGGGGAGGEGHALKREVEERTVK